MKFRTEIDIQPFVSRMAHQQHIFTIGSCFAENIAKKLNYYFFTLQSNPFGVLYNPLSIHTAIDEIISKRIYSDSDLFCHDDLWHSFQHHSEFSSPDLKDTLSKINRRIEASNRFLHKTDWAIVTYGTAFVYRLVESGIVVANCHKLPAKRFNRERVRPQELADEIRTTIKLLRSANSTVKCIFTVSPIRHWKDGAEENQLSKASLILAIHEAIAGKTDCFYFPSYEIMMDDLRDYRFYEDNLLHPNRQAIDYIWEKFRSAVLDESCLQLLPAFEKLRSAAAHQPFNPQSEAHQQFITKNLQQITELETRLPYADFSEVKRLITEQIVR